jgi:hypothetical protein
MNAMNATNALVFVAKFGIIAGTKELYELRAALFEIMEVELSSITRYPWANIELEGTPKELLMTIQAPNSSEPFVPAHMFEWLWPFLREYMMSNWLPSLAITLHHFIKTPAEGSEHWDILLAAAVEAETITTVLCETWTDDSNAEVDPEDVNESIEKLKKWGIRTVQDRTEYGSIISVLRFNPFLFKRKDTVPL